ncbi:MAG: glycosyltransferase family 2 protein, partial [Candidatus Gracilibacteria bacterium]
MKTISVVIPCYNEALNIPELHERLVSVFNQVQVLYQIIFVENGSKDNSKEILKDLARKDKNVMVPILSRNFGPQGAFTAGMNFATGDAVILMDGDLQDPPEMIPQFIEKWQQGFPIVYGVRTKRKGSLFRRIGYKLFYRLFRKMSYLDIPLDAGEFGLLDQKVVKVMRSLPERDRYLRGLRAWTGFKHTGVPYHRPDRKYGETATSFFDNFHWAMLGLFS